MESAMRKMVAAGLVATAGCWRACRRRPIMCRRSRATTPAASSPFRWRQSDARQLAVDHCAYYGKVVKFLAVQAYEGGYISFACRWVPYGAKERPLVTLY